MGDVGSGDPADNCAIGGAPVLPKVFLISSSSCDQLQAREFALTVELARFGSVAVITQFERGGPGETQG